MANSRTGACNIQGKLCIFIVPGNMEMLKKYTKQTKPPHLWEYAKGPNERAPTRKCWNNLNYKINKLVLDYNSRYKINIHESTLIQIRD